MPPPQRTARSNCSGSPSTIPATYGAPQQDLWIARNRDRLKKLCRLYEYLADYFYCDNAYSTEPQKLRNYCFAFNYAARLRS